MIKKILLSAISFLYTMLYILAIDVNIFIFDFLLLFSENNTVSGTMMDLMSLLIIIILSGGVVFFAVFLSERIKGCFVWIYISSLLASFLMPVFFGSLNSTGFIRFHWIFMAGIMLILNALFGPAMLFLLSCFIVKIIKKRKKKINEVQ